MASSRPASTPPNDVGRHVGLVLVESEHDPVLPTIVAKKTSDTGTALDYEDYATGAAIDPSVPASLRIRGFKGDLHKKDSALKKYVRTGVGAEGTTEKDSAYNAQVYEDIQWEMAWGKDGGTKRYFKLGTHNSRARLLSPVDITEVFLARLCTNINNALRRQIPNLGKIYYRFTCPYYSDKNDRNQYRAHIRTCIEAIQKRRHYPNSVFLLDEGEWQYEQYGVYFYYVGVEKIITATQKGDTYLIVDVGGSTTDLAFIQVFKRKDRPEATPVARTVKFAGRHIDEFLAQAWLGDAFDPDDDEALRAVEQAKIALCMDPETPVEVVWGERLDVWSYDTLAAMLTPLWADPDGPIRRALAELLADAERKAASNRQFKAVDTVRGVFLAGGSSALPGLEGLVRDVMGDRLTDNSRFVHPKAPRSTLAAIGLAWQVGNRLGLWSAANLKEAEWIAARLTTGDGMPVSFTRRGIGRESGQADLPEGTTFLGTLDQPEAKWDVDGFIDRTLPLESVQGDWNVQFFNDLYSPEAIDAVQPVVWGHSPSNVVKLNERLDGQPVDVSFTMKGEAGNESLRCRPYLRAAYSPQEQILSGSYSVPLGPPSIALSHPADEDEQTAHVCIDLGMSNTAVAVLLESEHVPESASVMPLDQVLSASMPGGGPAEVLPAGDSATDEAPVEAQSSEEPSTEDLSADNAPTEDSTAETPPPEDPPTEDPHAEVPAETPTDQARNVAIGVVEDLRQHPCEAELRETLSTAREWTDVDILDQYKQRLDAATATVQLSLHSGDDVEHLVYPDATVRTVLAEVLKVRSRLVILAGPPGTGKSRLVRAIAHFLNGDLPGAASRDLFYHLEPVSPLWMGPSSLNGWYSEIDGHFHPTGFWSALNRVRWHNDTVETTEDRRTFCICLDEFNIARPEQYLSDVLSRMESSDDEPVIPVAHHELDGLADMVLPPNVKLFATLNIDAAAAPLSPKVLDRGCFVHLSCTEKTIRAAAALHLDRERREGRDDHNAALASLRTLLLGPDETPPKAQSHPGLLALVYAAADAGQSSLGYRVLDMALDHAARQASLFAPTPEESGLFAAKLADDLLCSFFLPRLPSLQDSWLDDYPEHIEALQVWCAEHVPDGRAAGLIARLDQGPGQTAWPRFKEAAEATATTADRRTS